MQFLATLLAKVLQLLHAEQYEDLPEIGARILAGAMRIAILLRIRSHLCFTEDRVRLLRRVALQIKQSAFSMATVIKSIAASQSLEDVDSIKQEVRAVATLLQQVPGIAKSEASSSSESAALLPGALRSFFLFFFPVAIADCIFADLEKSVLMTRLYKAIKDLFASLGQGNELMPPLQSSLQAILEAVKKVNEGGVMPSVPKFLSGVVDFSAAIATVSENAVAETDKSQQDAREKAEALENAVLIERVQLLMLANMVVLDPSAAEKFDLMLHHVGIVLQLLADNYRKVQATAASQSFSQ